MLQDELTKLTLTELEKKDERQDAERVCRCLSYRLTSFWFFLWWSECFTFFLPRLHGSLFFSFFFLSLSLFYIFSKSFLSLPQFKSFWALYSLLLVPQCTAKVDLWENVEIYTGFENEKLKGIFFHAWRVKMAVAVKNLQLRFVCVWFRKRDNEARCNLLCKCFYNTIITSVFVLRHLSLLLSGMISDPAQRGSVLFSL